MSYDQILEACSIGDLPSLKSLLSNTSTVISDTFVSDMLQKATYSQKGEVMEYLIKTFNPEHIDDKVYFAAACSRAIPIFNIIFNRDRTCITEFFERRGTLLAVALAAAMPPELITHMLQLGADPNTMSADTISPLAYAANQYNTPDMIKLLLQHGVKINGSSALAASAHRGNIGNATYLLDHGADVNEYGNWVSPSFPLHMAIHRGHFDMVRLLLDNGADPNLKDGRDKNAFDIAWEGGRAEIIQFLQKHPKTSEVV